MLPNLKPGQNAICFNWAYFFSSPQTSDIVVAQINSRLIIKRVEKIKDQQVFLTGDNKSQSSDSREFGWVDQKQILGKIVFTLS